MSCPVTIRIQEDDFDIAREIAVLTKSRTDIGAVVSFSGICRADDDSAKVAALTLDCVQCSGRRVVTASMFHAY